jgi:hypothetical protein
MVANGYLRFVVEYDAQGAPYVPPQMPTSDEGKAGSARKATLGNDDGQDIKQNGAHNNPTPGHAQDGQVDEDVQLHSEHVATGANDSDRKADSRKRKLDDGEEGREERSEKEFEKAQRERGGEGAAVQTSESTYHATGEGAGAGMDRQMVDSTMAEGRRDDTKKKKKKKEKKKEPETTAEANDPNGDEEGSGQSVAALEEEIRRLKEQIAGIGCEAVSGRGEGLDEQSDHVVTSEQHQRAKKKKKKKKKKKAEDSAEYVPRLSASEREALIAEALSQVALLRASD